MTKPPTGNADGQPSQAGEGRPPGQQHTVADAGDGGAGPAAGLPGVPGDVSPGRLADDAASPDSPGETDDDGDGDYGRYVPL
jgi:hypothetical protein